MSKKGPSQLAVDAHMQRSAIHKLRSLPAKKASFVEPMECLSVARLPEGPQWVWEIKLDGYRALAVKSGSDVTLFSHRRKSLNRQFPYIVERLVDLPDGTVVDGELVAIDDSGRPDFHLLQNFRAEASRIRYYIFDLLCCKDHDLTRLPLIERRVLLKSLVMIHDKRIRISDYVEAGAIELLAAVREQHLEGIVGKRKDSPYQPGKRSGAWIKYRVNRGQELVIGGYTRAHTALTRSSSATTATEDSPTWLASETVLCPHHAARCLRSCGPWRGLNVPSSTCQKRDRRDGAKL